MGKLTLVLSKEEYDQGFEGCRTLVKNLTGWDLKKSDYYAKKHREAKLTDVLASDNSITVKDVVLQKYYKEAVEDFALSHEEALRYAKSNVFESAGSNAAIVLLLTD